MARKAWMVFALVLVAGLLLVQVQQYRVLERMASRMGPTAFSGLTTTWTSGGEIVTVHTDPEIGESDASVLVRHTAAVKAKLAEKPMDH